MKKETEQMPEFTQTKISKAINNVINGEYKVVTDNDHNLLKDSNFSWDDLNQLKEELAAKVMEFIHQVTSIINTPEILNNLNEHIHEFNKTVEIFFTDMNDFSSKVKNLREQHETKSGLVTNLDDYDLYNRVAVHYHSAFTELISLITPTLSELVLIASEATNIAKQKQEVKVEEPISVSDEKIIEDAKNE